MGIKQSPTATLPRRVPTQYDSQQKGWGRCHMAVVTVSVSALLATLVTFMVLNFLLGEVPSLPNLEPGASVPGSERVQKQSLLTATRQQADAVLASAPSSNSTAKAPDPVVQPVQPPPRAEYKHLFPEYKGYYRLAAKDESPRCSRAQICDGDHSCGPDKLGCITAAADRKERVRQAIAWAWRGYR